ncbi:hypothetical protein FB451DRAFT_1189231 [Mycena latifolia]|nr:hypothetical protein FB451DRAFT_1189231 [Mycena latifolia]
MPVLHNYRGLDRKAVETRIFELLSDAGVDPVGMVEALTDTGSIISGSTALLALVNLQFVPNDLDVYVPAPSEVTMLGILTDVYHFSLDRTQSNSYPSNKHILRTHWLIKGDRVINVMVVDGDNAVVAIFPFHSTIVMNFITGMGIYCAYPDLTLSKIGVRNNGLPYNDRALACLAKYAARGIIFRQCGQTHIYGDDKHCPSAVRTLHDDVGLLIPITSHSSWRDSVLSPHEVYDGFKSVVWSLGGPRCNNAGVYNETFAMSIPVFRRMASDDIF